MRSRRARIPLVLVVALAAAGALGRPVAVAAQTSRPDLVIEALSLSSPSRPAGSPVTVSYRVANRGAAAVTVTYSEQFWLSTNGTLGGTDVALGASPPHPAPLAPGATATYSQAVTIPAGTAPRNYFVLVQADSRIAIGESSEVNNVTAVALAVDPSSGNPVPSLTSLQPSSATEGAPAFTLTVNGAGFVGGASTVRWNGSPRTTAFVNAGRLTAQITSADIQTAGPRPVTVQNAAPGGGVSNPLNFTVNPGGTAGGWQGTWTRMANLPFDGRGWIDITFDELNGRTVIFGGSGAQYRNDIWRYNAATDVWTNVEPDVPCGGSSLFYERHAPPTPRDEHAVEYDSFNHLYWTFGGSGFSCVNANRTAGAGTTTTTIFDPTLTQATVDYYKDWTVGSGQEGRAYVNAYDPVTKRLTLSAPVAELGPGAIYRLYPQRGGGTYYYSPATGTWQGLNRHWNYTGQTPISRLSPALAYSPLHRAMVMFGGTGSFSADTWRLDVVSKTWSVLKGSGAPGQPPPLFQITNSMVYDRANDVFILFGGRCESCSPNVRGETWAYDLNTNTWINMQPAVSPPARQQHTMVYDTVNEVVIAFGGKSAAGLLLNDTWVYDYPANRWSQVNTPVAPSPRRLHGLAYDSVNQVSVTTGGVADVWQLELTPP